MIEQRCIIKAQLKAMCPYMNKLHARNVELLTWCWRPCYCSRIWLAKNWLFKTDDMKIRASLLKLDEQWRKGSKASFVQVSVSMLGNDQRRRKRGALGARAPQDFSINKEVPYSCLEHAPFFLRKNVPLKCRAPQVGDASYIPESLRTLKNLVLEVFPNHESKDLKTLAIMAWWCTMNQGCMNSLLHVFFYRKLRSGPCIG